MTALNERAVMMPSQRRHSHSSPLVPQPIHRRWLSSWPWLVRAVAGAVGALFVVEIRDPSSSWPWLVREGLVLLVRAVAGASLE
ncbi:hypothetical protein [Arthrobacter sp. HLT1-20]